ncbi:MAG: hypothetical protein C4541_08425 [Candidatus Auribacter fodinae]|uniref:Uncharacterized protein n=1 Tax=Candidatus Auribacter fodinae TaxID=2093366 RepID=A0A3A4R9Q6_9BACT|nr:MAG: hypothetical protein C4541_08425 [Candidatus Auribacter fodinae]
MKLFSASLLTATVVIFLNQHIYAMQEIVNDDISTRVTVGSSTVSGYFDISHLFSENIVIDSASVSFSFSDDSDLIYDHSIKTPSYSSYYYSGNYYSYSGYSSYTDGYGYTNYVDIYGRTENRYYTNVQESVNIVLDSQSASASTTSYSNSSTFSGDDGLFIDQVIDNTRYWKRYEYSGTNYMSGYNGDAFAQIDLDAASLLYLTVNQGISFDLSCGAGEDIYFNSASMTLEYHIEEIVVPEPHSIILLASGIALLIRRICK